MRLARRSLALRPAHSRRHLYVTCYTEGFSHFVTSMTAPVASGWSVAGWGLHPLESAAFSRRTREADIVDRDGNRRSREGWANPPRRSRRPNSMRINDPTPEAALCTEERAGRQSRRKFATLTWEKRLFEREEALGYSASGL